MKPEAEKAGVDSSTVKNLYVNRTALRDRSHHDVRLRFRVLDPKHARSKGWLLSERRVFYDASTGEEVIEE